MKLLAFPFVIATMLLGITPVAASGAPAPALAHHTGHPLVSAQTAHDLAPSPLVDTKPIAGHTLTSQASNALQREVFGFALASSLSDPTFGYPSWNFSLLSTVAFFGLHINDDGTIAADQGWTVWNSAQLTNLINAAHPQGSRVVLTIIEQDFSAGTPHMCAALTNRAATVSQALAQVSAKGVDGVNLDFEGLNGTCPNGQSSQSMMTDLAHQLRTALPAGSYLSVDTYASSASDSLGFFDVPGLNAYVDSFFVMAYDLEYSNYLRPPTSCGSFCLGPTAPLGAYYYNDAATAGQYSAVVPASKVILGVPYYGRKSCVASATANAYPTGSVTADTYLDASNEASSPDVQAGSYATHRDANDPTGQERWDTWFNTALNCTRELYWDDAVSLGLKYDLVNKDGLRGVGIWNLNYGGGAPELWNLFLSHFVGCINAAVTAAPSSPQATGVQTKLTASSANCANPRYEFWILPPGGAWTVAQAYSTSATFSWNTTGFVGGTYHFSVWVRDANSTGTFGTAPNTYDTFAAIDYALNASPCTAISATAAPPSPANVGAPATITGSATGCPNALYAFWQLPPGGNWFVAQPYSTSATFKWNTTGQSTGSYLFAVWARDTSSPGTSGTSPNTYDAASVVPYSLAMPSCTANSVLSAPASPASAGTPINITGSATGCPSPLYQFWLLPPGGTWTLVQAYSTSKTFNWSTGGSSAGSYLFSVWARDANSPGTSGTSPYTYDAVGTLAYSLVLPSCSATGASSAPAASANVGTAVTITGSATGCPNPLYQFWLLAPGGTWMVVQAYSTSPTFKWDTTGRAAGSYLFSVWARDAGSSNPYDSFNTVQLALTTGCSAVSTSSAPITKSTVGSPVTVTGSATGCPNPLYEFWLLPPGGTWSVAQPYSTNATFKWNTIGQSTGAYLFAVWARDTSSAGTSGASPNTYDAAGVLSYALTLPSCTAISVSPAPASPASAGTPITIAGSATGCPNPLYQFWLLPPGGTWTLVRPYSTSTTFNWSTAGKPAGSYLFSVWARDANSPGTSGTAPYTYDAVSTLPFTLS